ncbi:MAG: hypothetical protein ABII26_08715 [Pseudomonadota bacterium]
MRKKDRHILKKGMIWLGAVLILSGTCSLAGCEEEKDKVAQELVDYINKGVLGIAELEKRSLEQYASVIGKNFTTEERVYKALRDYVIPTYKRFLDGLRLIPAKSEEIRRLHGIYVNGADLLYEGFRLKSIGLEQKDEKIILMGNDKIEKGRIENERWRNEVMALAKKYGAQEEGKKEEKQVK